MRKYKGRLLAASSLCLTLTCAVPGCALTARAAGPGQENPVVSGALADNVLEYGEIPDLIGFYNTEVVNAEETATNREDLEAAKQLRDEARELSEEARTLKEEGLKANGTQALYDQYKASAKQLRTFASNVEDAAKPSGSAKLQLKQLKASQTMLAQSLMIQYEKLQNEKALADKNAETAAAQYGSAQRKQQLGMLSAAQVTAAEQAMKTAQAEAAAKAGELNDTKYNLCIMTGWNYDSNPEICRVPDPDASRIAAMNPEADLSKAIGNSFSLQETRHASATGRANHRIKSRNIDQGNQSLAVTLRTLYSDVLNAQAIYASKTSEFQAAQTAMNAADQKQAMGMLGTSDYLQEQSNYLSASADYDAARLDFFWAMETYDWAVNGLVSGSGSSGSGAQGGQ